MEMNHPMPKISPHWREMLNDVKLSSRREGLNSVRYHIQNVVSNTYFVNVVETKTMSALLELLAYSKIILFQSCLPQGSKYYLSC